MTKFQASDVGREFVIVADKDDLDNFHGLPLGMRVRMVRLGAPGFQGWPAREDRGVFEYPPHPDVLGDGTRYLDPEVVEPADERKDRP